MDFASSKGYALCDQLAAERLLWRGKRVQIAHAVNALTDDGSIAHATFVSGLEEEEVLKLKNILVRINIYEINLDELQDIAAIFEPKSSFWRRTGTIKMHFAAYAWLSILLIANLIILIKIYRAM